MGRIGLEAQADAHAQPRGVPRPLLQGRFVVRSYLDAGGRRGWLLDCRDSGSDNETCDLFVPCSTPKSFAFFSRPKICAATGRAIPESLHSSSFHSKSFVFLIEHGCAQLLGDLRMASRVQQLSALHSTSPLDIAPEIFKHSTADLVDFSGVEGACKLRRVCRKYIVFWSLSYTKLMCNRKLRLKTWCASSGSTPPCESSSLQRFCFFRVRADLCLSLDMQTWQTQSTLSKYSVAGRCARSR